MVPSPPRPHRASCTSAPKIRIRHEGVEHALRKERRAGTLRNVAIADYWPSGRNLKVAFVASGGATRGLAHLGVLRACQDLGIQPEIFVGASFGALVAAAYGQNMALDLLFDDYRWPWRQKQGPRLHLSSVLGPPTWRDFKEGRLLSGLFSIDRFERHLSRQLPVNDFRDLPYPVFVTAVDVDRCERVVFGQGYEEQVTISKAIAASCCVPGLFRPYRIGNAYYMDGEVAHTLSVDLAIRAGADLVIISNVYQPNRRPSDGDSLARGGLLRVINQTLSILLSEKERTGVQLHQRQNPETTFIDIAPDLGSYGYFNRFATWALMMRGYQAATLKLAPLLRSASLGLERTVPGTALRQLGPGTQGA